MDLDFAFNDRTLESWLERIQAMHPEEIELGLERIRIIAERLDVLKPAPTCVLIGGTNGKGSTTALMQTLLMAQGKQVGVYSSPHLLRFNERIKCNESEISDADLCACFEKVDQARGDTPLTYFEFTTLAALVYFKQKSLDICLLEIGMGGRLDAVNLVEADLSVITSIGLDHQDWLGDTLDEIGREKAGIAKKDKALVCGQLNPPESIAKICQQEGACLHQAGVDFGLQQHLEQTCYWFDSNNKVSLSLSDSIVVQANIATALEALRVLGCLPTQTLLNHTLTNLRIAGRMQTFHVKGEKGRFSVILDVAHNPQAVSALSKKINNIDGIIISMLKDKNAQAVINGLPDCEHWFLPELDDFVSRRAYAKDLAQHIKADYKIFDSVDCALDAMLRQAKPNENWLVLGSFYTIEASLRYIQASSINKNRKETWTLI